MKTHKQCLSCVADIICGKNVFPTDAACKVFTDNVEALKPSHNKQSAPFAKCDDCNEDAEYHYCSECMDNHRN